MHLHVVVISSFKTILLDDPRTLDEVLSECVCTVQIYSRYRQYRTIGIDNRIRCLVAPRSKNS